MHHKTFTVPLPSEANPLQRVYLLEQAIFIQGVPSQHQLILQGTLPQEDRIIGPWHEVDCNVHDFCRARAIRIVW